jgi:hypothetical protein
MSSFLLVVKKSITISEHPSTPRFLHAAALKQLNSLVFKTLSSLEIKRRIKESVQFYFLKNNDVDRNILLQEGKTPF